MYIVHVQFKTGTDGTFTWSGIKGDRLGVVSGGKVRMLGHAVPCSTGVEFAKWLAKINRCVVTSMRTV